MGHVTIKIYSWHLNDRLFRYRRISHDGFEHGQIATVDIRKIEEHFEKYNEGAKCYGVKDGKIIWGK
jgi:hypothetical protein